MRRPTLVRALLLGLALGSLGSSTPLRAEEPEPIYQSFSVSTGIDLSTGTYDRRVETDDLYIPFSFTYERGPWLGKITLPLLYTRGPGDPQTLNTGDSPGGPMPSRRRIEGESDFGIGDITVDLSHYWAPSSTWLPTFELGVRVKIPTASVEEDLGTGEWDFTLGLDVARRIGDWTPFAHVGYRFLGDSDDFQLDDGFETNIGMQYKLNDRLNIGVTYDWRQSTNSIQADPQEISPYVTFLATDHITVIPYAAFGLTTSSLDAGAGLTLSYRF